MVLNRLLGYNSLGGMSVPNAQKEGLPNTAVIIGVRYCLAIEDVLLN
jgi:hypothetical protein